MLSITCSWEVSNKELLYHDCLVTSLNIVDQFPEETVVCKAVGKEENTVGWGEFHEIRNTFITGKR
jgi:hypothetical protein